MFKKLAKNCELCQLNESLEFCLCGSNQEGKEHGKINIDKVIEGQLANKSNGKIAKEAGSLATSPSALSQVVPRVMKTQEYQEKASEVITRLENIRNKQLTAIENSDLDKTEHEKLVNSLDKILKNINLLNGEATSRIDVNESDVSQFLNIS